MVVSKLKAALAAVAVAATGLLGAAGAQAALYTGQWDPAYGGIFPSLGWKASAVFDVPGSCLALGTANDVPVTAGPCAGFSVLSAQLQFYDVAAPGTVLGTYALNPSVIVTGVDIAGGALAGVDTGFFDYVVPSLAVAGSGSYSFSLILYGGTLAQLAYANPIATSPGCAFLPVPGARCGLSQNPAQGVFAAVAAPIPEPETYALMLAGLAGLGAVARRRRARAAA
jgi:hypothetical protein